MGGCFVFCFVFFTIKVCLEFSFLSRCSSRVFLGVSAVGTTVEFAVVQVLLISWVTGFQVSQYCSIK